MTIHTPIPDYDTARAAMVDGQLRPQGVTDRAVLAAMGTVKREEFVPEDVRPLAYADRSLSLGQGRHLPPPAALGQLLTQIAPRSGERVLVVGGGGYSAAVLSKIGCAVTLLEGSPALAARPLPPGVSAVEGPLEAGYKAGAPYDIILVDGAVEAIPEAFINQLADGGRLGGALIDRGVTRLIVGRKVGTAFGYLSIGDSAVAPLPGFSRPREFTF